MSEEVGAKFCPKIVLPNYEPKIRSMHEREELKTKVLQTQKDTCLYMSMLLDLISRPYLVILHL
ncbi:hypothetical protein CYANOKiyG1_42640 [Okeania sp. KiyG1]|nr:hypothetical protein CYANOKiyG1_42640 [Okeania sp. KiyG1]